MGICAVMGAVNVAESSTVNSYNMVSSATRVKRSVRLRVVPSPAAVVTEGLKLEVLPV